ncbi:MAG: sugar phosphate nucleotidyltransferase [Anaerolineales bacterium]|jgi:glucose-1-phosphate thymidylyltransferase
MKLVLPMAGYGTRLRPLTWSKPKPLISVAGKPILGHVLEVYAGVQSIDEVILIVGYLGEQIEDFVSRAFPKLRAHYVEQVEMRGQSHALWLAREYLQGPMLMLFVDTLIEADLLMLKTEQAGAVAWVREVDDPRRFGVAEVGDDGWVRRLVEKPEDSSNNLAVVGFYYFQQAEDLVSAIDEQMARKIHLKNEYYLADAVNIMLERGLRMRVEHVAVWQDCGKPETLLQTNQYLLERGRDNSKQAAKRDGVEIVPPVFVDPTANLSHSAIGPNVSIGASCTIERSSIRDSIVEAEAHISDSSLSASLIGNQARVAGYAGSLNVGDSSTVGFA